MSKNINRPLDNLSSNNNKTDKNYSVLDEMTDQARGAGRAVREFAEDAQKNLSAIQHRAEDRIRTHPLATCAAILLSGILIGAIMRRK